MRAWGAIRASRAASQFAKHPIQSVESVGTIRSLQYFLQDWRCKPDGLSMFESIGEQCDLEQIIAA
jgi:hypothetical protein